MGPPTYIGGNFDGRRRAQNHHGRFNGATDLHRWKHVLLHDPHVGVCLASMGPPTYIGGNCEVLN